MLMLAASEAQRRKVRHFSFSKKQNKDVSILTETNINHDQLDKIRNNLLEPFFHSSGDNHRLLVLTHLGLEG